MVPWFDFIILALATFRFTRLLVFDQITAFLRKPFHDIVEEETVEGKTEQYLMIRGSGMRKWIGELLSCYWCAGMWCAVVLYSGYLLYPVLFFPVTVLLALAGVASVLEVMVERLERE